MADVSWPLFSESSFLSAGSSKAEEQMLNACLLIKSFSIARAGSVGTMGHAFHKVIHSMVPSLQLSSCALLTGYHLLAYWSGPASERPVKYRLLALMKGSR